MLIDLSSWYKEMIAPKIELIQDAIEERLSLIHISISIIAFIFRENLLHGIRQWLIFPRAVFVCKILVKSLSADMKDPAEKSDIRCV